MKRDVDLIREILIKVEETDFSHLEKNPWRPFHINGYDAAKVEYHVRMILERKFFYEDAIILLTSNHDGTPISKYRADALTNSGHEFLETIRDPEIWRQTKTTAKQMGSFSITLLKALAIGYFKAKVKKHAGLDIEI